MSVLLCFSSSFPDTHLHQTINKGRVACQDGFFLSIDGHMKTSGWLIDAKDAVFYRLSSGPTFPTFFICSYFSILFS